MILYKGINKNLKLTAFKNGKIFYKPYQQYLSSDFDSRILTVALIFGYYYNFSHEIDTLEESESLDIELLESQWLRMLEASTAVNNRGILFWLFPFDNQWAASERPAD